MRFALLSLRYDYRRFLGGVLAVGVSKVLICLMVGIMLGLISLTSAPIDRSGADIWVAGQATPSCDLAVPINRSWANTLAMDPAVTATDEVILGYSLWKNPELGNVMVLIVGMKLGPDSLGPVQGLTDDQRLLLTEPGAVLLDRGDVQRIGVERVGSRGEVFGYPVHVVGFVDGMPSVTGPYVLCSIATAREIVRMPSDQVTFVIARCRSKAMVPGVVARSKGWRGITVWPAEQFSLQTRTYWLRTTKVGLGVLFLAGLSLFIGTMVTSQTLYAATLASVKELAILRALGAPRWRVRLFVLQHSFLVGAAGVCLGLPASLALSNVAAAMGATTLLPVWLIALAGFVTLAMALFAGLFALRVLRKTEPALLLR